MRVRAGSLFKGNGYEKGRFFSLKGEERAGFQFEGGGEGRVFSLKGEERAGFLRPYVL